MLRVRVVSATAKVSEAVIPATGNFGLREKVPVTRLVYVFDESRIWALKSPRVYLVVVVMFCVALVIIYYYLAFIFIHSVRGIGIVLVNVCKIIHIYIYIYIYIYIFSGLTARKDVFRSLMPGKPIDFLVLDLVADMMKTKLTREKWLLVFTYNFCDVREDKIGSQPSAVLYHRCLFGQS